VTTETFLEESDETTHHEKVFADFIRGWGL
jgi:hypothetical protein